MIRRLFIPSQQFLTAQFIFEKRSQQLQHSSNPNSKETAAKMGSSSSSSSSKQTVEPVNVDEPALHLAQANVAAAVDLISFELVDVSSGQLGQSLDDKHSLGLYPSGDENSREN
ncbi:hypothetical protein DAPPUDRAFT_246601 [Daphnia pulex]|uniref:Uncharacterized protein n=1 Tax=Daphnia pulex TaxID=6669 RepID=E9GQZ4_DAPPU|nr:hypothetical protein DAPPUDRAFT_246601 [Daphnia pulex]|eukprot:EFX78202.1 hypothetical protein DAPPUDRAFT_246601 [Daphnia pulex]